MGCSVAEEGDGGGGGIGLEGCVVPALIGQWRRSETIEK